MDFSDRRRFLQMGGAAAGAMIWPGMIDRALAIPANRRTGTIRDVEHIVVCMQENRSFDHYLGMLNGVRGFGDPRPHRIKGGRSIWAQPSTEHADGYVLPFHGDSRISRSFKVDGAEQAHQENVQIFNRGRCDRWGNTAELHKRMLHYTAGDLPFYYALADAFTVCDAYHCSTMTQTYPNRMHLFTGCNGGGTVGGDPEMSNYGEDLTPSADMREDKPLREDAYQWTTYAERLQAAGVSWKVYQEYDNFGDNLLSVFPAFRPCARDSELYRRGRSWVSEHKTGADRKRSDGEQLVEAFRRDIAADTLPQISWIVTAADLSEHPTATPADGEHVVAKLIEALVDHPEVFAKTVFILNFDEVGGFYDHMAPPVPPVGDYRGHSTVPVDGETKNWTDPKLPTQGEHPIGLGFRTPTIIVSPWSRGGFVNSQLFDHTSVLQFMEARFGVAEPNIGAWRRSVCGDLTSVFDFAGGGETQPPKLPATDDFRARVARSLAGTANAIPETQKATVQMAGQRPHRPLPYRFDVSAAITPERRLRLDMANPGPVGVCFTVHDNTDAQEPWHFTIGAGDHHASEAWHDADTLQAYDVTLRGPNGFWRRYAGSLGEDGAVAEVALVSIPDADGLALMLHNGGTAAAEFLISLDPRYPVTGERSRRITVAPGETKRDTWSLSRRDQWYDLSITLASDPAFVRRFAGKVETGRPGRTDPGIGTMQVTV
jgi:phospholipase C